MSLDNYVEVKDRVLEFVEKYPEGSLQSTYEFRTLNGTDVVVVTAHAFRSPTDPIPATGLAYEQIPGSTNFTRGSELEVAQTSAWGRALGALGIGIAGAIATTEDVRVSESKGKSTGTRTPSPSSEPRRPSNKGYIASEKQRGTLKSLDRRIHGGIGILMDEVLGERVQIDELTGSQASALISRGFEITDAEKVKVKRTTSTPQDDAWNTPLIDPETGEVAS